MALQSSYLNYRWGSAHDYPSRATTPAPLREQPIHEEGPRNRHLSLLRYNVI
jgi:hypothetical protein